MNVDKFLARLTL